MGSPQVHDPRRNHPENFCLLMTSVRESKDFFRFDSQQKQSTFLTTQGGLAQVLNMPKTTVLYFDLDRPDTRFSSETMAMLTARSSYLSEIFKFDFVPIPGENCQLAQASTDVKHQSICATCVS
jgi:hypothetical protein